MIDRADATGAGLAVAAHAALLAALIFLVDTVPKGFPSQPAIEVSFVDETGMVSGGETIQPAAASVAPELGAPEDAAPVPDPSAAPQPIVAQPTPSQAAPPGTPQPRATPQQRTTPAPSPPRQQRSGSGAAPSPRGSRLGPDFLKGIGNDPASTSQRTQGAVVTNQVRASIDSVLYRALLPCRRQSLTVPPDAPVTRVRVAVTFRPDGSIADLSSTMLSNAESRYRTAYVEAAERVAQQCAARLRTLATEFPQFYDVRRGWRHFRYDFPQ